MNRKEHLLVIALEECNEIAQTLSKILRFGVDRTGPKTAATAQIELKNNDLFYQELSHLEATIEMLEKEDVLENIQDSNRYYQWKYDKKINIEKYLSVSEKCGTLNSTDSDTIKLENINDFDTIIPWVDIQYIPEGQPKKSGFYYKQIIEGVMTLIHIDPNLIKCVKK